MGNARSKNRTVDAHSTLPIVAHPRQPPLPIQDSGEQWVVLGVTVSSDGRILHMTESTEVEIMSETSYIPGLSRLILPQSAASTTSTGSSVPVQATDDDGENMTELEIYRKQMPTGKDITTISVSHPKVEQVAVQVSGPTEQPGEGKTTSPTPNKQPTSGSGPSKNDDYIQKEIIQSEKIWLSSKLSELNNTDSPNPLEINVPLPVPAPPEVDTTPRLPREPTDSSVAPSSEQDKKEKGDREAKKVRKRQRRKRKDHRSSKKSKTIKSGTQPESIAKGVTKKRRKRRKKRQAGGNVSLFRGDMKKAGSGSSKGSDTSSSENTTDCQEPSHKLTKLVPPPCYISETDEAPDDRFGENSKDKPESTACLPSENEPLLVKTEVPPQLFSTQKSALLDVLPNIASASEIEGTTSTNSTEAVATGGPLPVGSPTPQPSLDSMNITIHTENLTVSQDSLITTTAPKSTSDDNASSSPGETGEPPSTEDSDVALEKAASEKSLIVFPISVQSQESQCHVGGLGQHYPMQPPSPETPRNKPLPFLGQYHSPGPGCAHQPLVTHGSEPLVRVGIVIREDFTCYVKVGETVEGVTECMWKWISNSASDAQLHRLCSGFIQKKSTNPMEFGFEWRSIAYIEVSEEGVAFLPEEIIVRGMASVSFIRLIGNVVKYFFNVPRNQSLNSQALCTQSYRHLRIFVSHSPDCDDIRVALLQLGASVYKSTVNV